MRPDLYKPVSEPHKKMDLTDIDTNMLDQASSWEHGLNLIEDRLALYRSEYPHELIEPIAVLIRDTRSKIESYSAIADSSDRSLLKEEIRINIKKMIQMNEDMKELRGTMPYQA